MRRAAVVSWSTGVLPAIEGRGQSSDSKSKRRARPVDKLPIDDDLKDIAKKAYEKILQEGKGK